jgi:hypothetical protein
VNAAVGSHEGISDNRLVSSKYQESDTGVVNYNN